MEPLATERVPFEAQAYQAFLSGMRVVWKDELYRQVIERAKNVPANGPAELERQMNKVPAYQMYGFLERRLHQYKYNGRWGMTTVMSQWAEHFSKVLSEASKKHPERLRLNPGLPVPDYVAEVDVHEVPGGIWDADYKAFSHEWYTSGLSFTGADPRELIAWFAKAIMSKLPAEASTFLDVGCTLGRVAQALKTARPNATVHGVDVSAPVLRLAHMRAVDQGMELYFSQQNAEKLDFKAGTFDAVVSHWLFHELPPSAMRNVIAEAKRVLKPGGLFAIYDMYLVRGGLVGSWLQSGFAARNNEPFAHVLPEMRLEEEMAKVGFTNITTEMRGMGGVTQDMLTLPNSRTHDMTLITGVAT